jgi:probable DNA metabolism protein
VSDSSRDEHVVLAYDGSFAGYLSAVFEVFRRKFNASIAPFEHSGESLFGPHVRVETAEDHATRIARRINELTDSETWSIVERAFLSEEPGREHVLLDYIRRIIDHGEAGAHNVLFESVLDAKKMAKRTDREVHRMHAFVRFEETEDGVFAARIAPDCDVVGLITPHFQRRYPAMQWAIFDERRRYGVFYDGKSVLWIEDGEATGEPSQAEEQFQRLWKSYYRSVNIQERRNDRLHLQHVPRRYWRYLTEKR